MGLDMYLNKMPRYKGVTAKQISAIEGYFDLEAEKAKGDEYKDYSLMDWCGHDESELPNKETIEFFKSFYVTRYSDWDTEKKYGWSRIMEQVGYWRKANAIHNWFVDHVQDGEDDCRYHQEVTKGVIEDLLETCEKVYNSCTMMLGYVKNGEQYKDGEWETIYEAGKVVIDPSVAEKLLPTASGFFFGSTSYDEYYVKDIEYTIDLCKRILETTDFEKEMLAYVSSW